MGRSTKVILLALCGILAVVLLTSAFKYWNQNNKEHLIMGVPYWGIYTGTEINSAQAFAVYTILQYWGDNRFTPKDIAAIFPSEMWLGTSDMTVEDFFRENGYEVQSLPHMNISEIIPVLEQNIPVISTLRLTPDYENASIGTERVVIGYSNKEEEVIVHDNSFGNNYVLSYSDYARMREGFASGLLVKPAAELAATLTPPDRTTPYPARSAAMDSESMRRIVLLWLGVAMNIKISTELRVPTAAESAALLEKMLAEPDFEKLHPAARMNASFTLARAYTLRLNEHQKAIDVLETFTLPLLGTDFSQPFGDWDRKIPADVYNAPLYTSQPWVLLGLAYERLGDLDAAKEAYGRAVDANPNDEDARARFEGRITASESLPS